MRSSILIAEYVLRSKLQTFHKSSRPPSSTASIAEGGKTWWNFSSWPSQYLLRPSKVLTLAFKHYIGSSCCRRLVVNNLNFHQVNSLLRRDIFFWIWFPHIFRRRFALQRIITTRQDQIRLTRISLLIRHSKLRIYITRPLSRNKNSRHFSLKFTLFLKLRVVSSWVSRSYPSRHHSLYQDDETAKAHTLTLTRGLQSRLAKLVALFRTFLMFSSINQPNIEQFCHPR